jgi:hypothetical protein
MPIEMGKSSRVVPLGKRTALLEVNASHAAAAEKKPGSAVAKSPMFGVAMLKIAMELKKAEPKSLEELITGVLEKMRLDEREFRGFLDANGGLLRAIAQRRKY